MTDQNGDQAALNALVNDCYPDGWPWQINDLTFHGAVIGLDHGNDDKQTLFLKFGNEQWIKASNRYPLAGTWVEGRLREEIGEAFWDMAHIKHDEWSKKVGGAWCCTLDDGEDDVQQVFADTPIQALVAALRVLKQKEVSGE